MEHSTTRLTDENFPSQLKEIPQPPKELWFKGVPPPSDTTYLTIVGARKHTIYGREACEKIVEGLRGLNITIVSGLAIGIDTIALTSALRADLRCVAVPGSGLDDSVLYPRSNLNLAKQIIERNGTLLSEYAPTFRATEWSFPQRNRIMAGLSRATLIIEAGKKSGTLITARLAADYNRDVYAVPGSIFSPLSEGPHMLISLGATPITSSEDLCDALGFPSTEKGESVSLPLSLSKEETLIMELLREPLLGDQIVNALAMPASKVNILLVKLQMAGLIIDTPNGYRRA